MINYKLLDYIKNNQLYRFYEVLIKNLNNKIYEKEWSLFEKQKQEILSAISEIEQGKVIEHKNVMSKIRIK